MLEYKHQKYAKLDGSSSDTTVDCKDVTDLRWAGSFFRNGLVELTAEIAAPGFSVASLGFGYRHHSPFAGRHRRAPCVGHDSLSSVCPGDAASAIRDTITNHLRELWQEGAHLRFPPEYGPHRDFMSACVDVFFMIFLGIWVLIGLILTIALDTFIPGTVILTVGVLMFCGVLFGKILPGIPRNRGPGISIFHTLIADVTPAVTAILAQHGLAGRLVLSAESKMMNQGLCYGHQYVFIRLEVVKSQLGWTLATASALTDQISSTRPHSLTLVHRYGKHFIRAYDMYNLFTMLDSIKKECEETDTKPQLGQQALTGGAGATPQIIVVDPSQQLQMPVQQLQMPVQQYMPPQMTAQYMPQQAQYMAQQATGVHMVAPVAPYVSPNA